MTNLALAKEIIEEIKDMLRGRADALDFPSSCKAVERILKNAAKVNILQKLQKIEEAKCLHDICFRKAGVGFMFFDETRIKELKFEPRFKSPLAKQFNLHHEVNCVNWREGLYVEHYYPTLKEAIEAEYKKLGVKQKRP